jgi:hypothetical protein
MKKKWTIASYFLIHVEKRLQDIIIIIILLWTAAVTTHSNDDSVPTTGPFCEGTNCEVPH